MTLNADISNSVDHCRADLRKVADDLKWAMAPGLAPEGRALDEPHGAALPERDPNDEHTQDPDYVAGPKWALDIGDGQLRSAFLDGVNKMAIAECRLVLAVTALHTDASQPPIVQLGSASSFILVDVCRITMERRLTIIERDLEMASHPAVRNVAYHLHGPTRRGDKDSARRALDLAVRKLSKAFARGSVAALWEPEPDKSVPVDKRCKVCGWRKKHRRYAPRCTTCGQWFKRHSAERPTYLDGINPQEAASKRRARGEGWGIA